MIARSGASGSVALECWRCIHIIRGMKPPSPTGELEGCVWLPRILWKARLSLAGKLPEAFQRGYCAPVGVDGHFLRFFGIDREDIEALAFYPDPEAAERFLRLPGVSHGKIREWNELAVNLGREGYPMAELMPIAKAGNYRHVATPEMETVFEILEADDATL